MDAPSDPRIPVADRAAVQGWLQPPLLDQTVTETLGRAVEVVRTIVTEGVEAAMNRFN